MASKKVLNIISDNFPHGTGEQFFEAEVKIMAGYFDEIVLFPLRASGELRDLPSNVKVNNVLSKTPREVSKTAVLSHFFLILKIVGFEWIRSKQRSYILKKMKRWASSIIQCNRLATDFAQSIDPKNENYFYSFWMNDGALLLSILKSKGKIDSFNFRVNGFDIFNERNDGNYMPFRYFNYKHVNTVFVLSREALNYLIDLNCYPEKLVLSHYGIFENGTNVLEDNGVIRVVSCANVIPLKRIDKIIDALAELKEFKLKWTHFGDGFLMDEIKGKAASLGDHVEVDFRGNVPNGEIIKTYENESVNLFMHTSETEGLGMAIIEAQSFGIPAVVIGVGGVLDIVSDQTGAVLKPEAEGPDLADAMRTVLNGEKNTQAYRKSIQEACYGIFNAERNYKAQYQKIIEVKKQ